MKLEDAKKEMMKFVNQKTTMMPVFADVIMNAFPRWIPVTERLPDHENHVLCCTATKKGQKNIVIGYYHHESGRWACGMNSNVIAWMPLPEPYEEGEELMAMFRGGTT